MYQVPDYFIDNVFVFSKKVIYCNFINQDIFFSYKKTPHIGSWLGEMEHQPILETTNDGKHNMGKNEELQEFKRKIVHQMTEKEEGR